MEGKYLSLGGETATEKVIEKSRFIATSRHICGDEEAKAFVAEVCARYPDATHNCYAYVADRLGNLLRFSDNGEPQGTAGMPMLEVLRAKNLRECAVVVTRYFGGIKLGAGGLVRAYSGCVAENLSSARIVSYEMCAECHCLVGYPEAETASRFLAGFGAEILDTQYFDGVAYIVAVKCGGLDDFYRAFADAVNGRVKIEKKGERFFPFPVK